MNVRGFGQGNTITVPAQTEHDLVVSPLERVEILERQHRALLQQVDVLERQQETLKQQLEAQRQQIKTLLRALVP